MNELERRLKALEEAAPGGDEGATELEARRRRREAMRAPLDNVARLRREGRDPRSDPEIRSVESRLGNAASEARKDAHRGEGGR